MKRPGSGSTRSTRSIGPDCSPNATPGSRRSGAAAQETSRASADEVHRCRSQPADPANEGPLDGRAGLSDRQQLDSLHQDDYGAGDSEAGRNAPAHEERRQHVRLRSDAGGLERRSGALHPRMQVRQAVDFARGVLGPVARRRVAGEAAPVTRPLALAPPLISAALSGPRPRGAERSALLSPLARYYPFVIAKPVMIASTLCVKRIP